MTDTVIALAIHRTDDGGFAVNLITTDGRTVTESKRLPTHADARRHADTVHAMLLPTIDLAIIDQTTTEGTD